MSNVLSECVYILGVFCWITVWNRDPVRWITVENRDPPVIGRKLVGAGMTCTRHVTGVNLGRDSRHHVHMLYDRGQPGL